jgi:hypothetical protein
MLCLHRARLVGFGVCLGAQGNKPMHPNPLVVRAYLFRGVLLWIVARATIAGALLLAGGDALKLSTTALVEVVLLIVALGWIETRRRREGVLLANLGVSPLMLSVFFAGPALLGEFVLRFVAALLA